MGWIEAGASFLGNERSNEANKREAKKNRDFQERMSNTAHVREIADLRNAGLNPILSARLGGATTPGGATASPQINSAKSAVDAYASTAALGSQIKQTEASTELTQADTKKRKAEAISAEYEAQKAIVKSKLFKGATDTSKGGVLDQAGKSVQEFIPEIEKLYGKTKKGFTKGMNLLEDLLKETNKTNSKD